MLNLVIMAGGKGERFWPLSRACRPKQLLSLSGDESLLQSTYSRLRMLAEPERIWVVTGIEQAPEVARQLQELPHANLIVEPLGRNTAACIGLAALVVERSDPDGVMAVFPADHRIGNSGEFCRLITKGCQVATNGGIVTLGIRPNRPETGFGYIKLGDPEPIWDDVFRVEHFIEKPNLADAKRYLASERYLWNSGIFIWQTSLIRALIARYMPALEEGLRLINAAIGGREYQSVLKDVYAKLEGISIDRGVIESAEHVDVLTAAMDWDDLGTWSAMRRIWEKDACGNVAVGKYKPIESSDNIIYSPSKAVVTFGIENMVVIETEDCLFLAPAGRDQAMRKVISALQQEGWQDYR